MAYAIDVEKAVSSSASTELIWNVYGQNLVSRPSLHTSSPSSTAKARIAIPHAAHSVNQESWIQSQHVCIRSVRSGSCFSCCNRWFDDDEGPSFRPSHGRELGDRSMLRGTALLGLWYGDGTLSATPSTFSVLCRSLLAIDCRYVSRDEKTTAAGRHGR